MNAEIAEQFERMGKLLEVQGANVFKIRAYARAAENLRSLGEDVTALYQEGRLHDIPGIGTELRDKIAAYVATGTIPAYEALIQEFPETLLDVMSVPSVGPKKARLFFDQLQIRDVNDLKKAAEDGRLLGLPGIKEKTVQNILRGVSIVSHGQSHMHLDRAKALADAVVTPLQQLKEVQRISVAGSLRRQKETVRDIDILVQSADPGRVISAFTRLPLVASVTAEGEQKASIRTSDGVQVDLRVVDEESYGAALVYFTGSKYFNVWLRQVALKKKMKVSEYGVFSTAGNCDTRVAGRTEEECLTALGLPYVPPELREELFEAAIFGGALLPELIDEKDIQGELHVHSTWSDGRHSIREMAEAARVRGYRYLAISDHSQKLRVARGIAAADLPKKRKEIDELNRTFTDFRILFGTEAEIDKDGCLDYDEAILRAFDIVIASVHTGFEQDRSTLTRRLVRACEHPAVNVIAHPTGVHRGKRQPYDIDFAAVCQAAAANKTCLEINAFPIRLDLNAVNAHVAKSQGVKLVINTDAHSKEHLRYMSLGIAVARRAGLTAQDVLNTQPWDVIAEWLGKS